MIVNLSLELRFGDRPRAFAFDSLAIGIRLSIGFRHVVGQWVVFCRILAGAVLVRGRRSSVGVWLVRGRRGVFDGVSSAIDAILFHVIEKVASLSYHLLSGFDRGSVLRKEAC